MKKIIIIILIVIIVFMGLYHINKLFIKYKPIIIKYFDKNECIEDGNCREGLTIFINNKKVTISEKTCNENKGKWNKKYTICYFH